MEKDFVADSAIASRFFADVLTENMWQTHDSDTPTAFTAKGFKSLEEVCSQKIKIVDSDNCTNELAVLYNNRGYSKYLQVEFDSAVEDYNRALQLNPNLAVAYYNRATIYYRMGNFKGALHGMQKALDLDPLNMEFHEGYNECAKMNNIGTQ